MRDRMPCPPSPPTVAAREPGGDPHREGEACDQRGQADRQARAVDQAAQDVAAEIVEAEPVQVESGSAQASPTMSAWSKGAISGAPSDHHR